LCEITKTHTLVAVEIALLGHSNNSDAKITFCTRFSSNLRGFAQILNFFTFQPLFNFFLSNFPILNLNFPVLIRGFHKTLQLPLQLPPTHSTPSRLTPTFWRGKAFLISQKAQEAIKLSTEWNKFYLARAL
jgi:hypothetical protein